MKELNNKILFVDNVANISWRRKKCLELFGIKTDVGIQKERFGFNYDFKIGLSRVSRLISLVKTLFKYKIIHFYYGRSFLYNNRDFLILKLFNKKLVMEFIGCDTRCKEMVKEQVEKGIRKFNICDYCNYDKNCESEKKKEMVKRVEKYCNLIITYPELNWLLNREYTFIPQVILMDELQNLIPKFNYKKKIDKIIVVHVTNVNRSKKGADEIIRIINKMKLKQSKDFEFILLENVPYLKVLEGIYISDIFIDEVILGTPGYLTLEAMAYKKPVLAYWEKKLIPYNKLPVINTTPENLEENLIMLIKDKKLREEYGKLGYEYVKRNHTPEVVGEKLIQLYQKLLQ